MIERQDFKIALGPLVSMFGDPSTNDPAFWEVYYRAIGHLPPDTLNAAVLLVVQTYVYNSFPKPAVVLDAAKALALPPARTGIEAWRDVLAKIKEHGHLRLPVFDDPKVQAAVDGIGWRTICFSNEADTYILNMFVKAYETMQTRERDAVPLLAGPGADVVKQLAESKKVTK